MNGTLAGVASPMGLYYLAAKLRDRGWRRTARLLQAVIFLLFKAVVPAEATIGPGTVIAHGGVGVVIHPLAIVGRNVLINSGVVIGGRRRSGAPRIGDNVYLGTGCKILGSVTVGSGSIIGANAVVTRDIPTRSIAVGIPARVQRIDVDVEDYEDLPAPVRPNG